MPYDLISAILSGAAAIIAAVTALIASRAARAAERSADVASDAAESARRSAVAAEEGWRTMVAQLHESQRRDWRERLVTALDRVRQESGRDGRHCWHFVREVLLVLPENLRAEAWALLREALATRVGETSFMAVLSHVFAKRQDQCVADFEALDILVASGLDEPKWLIASRTEAT